MSNTPSTSPSPSSVSPSNLISLKSKTDDTISRYCGSNPDFKEKFERLSDSFRQSNVLAQPAKAIVATPFLAGFFANFLAIYALLKIYSIVESDRVKFPGSPYAQTREPAIAGLTNAFEDVFLKSFKAFGYDIDSYRTWKNEAHNSYSDIDSTKFDSAKTADFFKDVRGDLSSLEKGLDDALKERNASMAV